jgi:flavin-dependent dehydrogenase
VIERDVIVVGGGPAGSSCAWRLAKHGIEALVLDRARFPRLKLCAGWITPEVVRALELDPATYPASFLTFETVRIHIKGMSFKLNAQQHSIRRIELDAWLLERSGAEVARHDVREIRREGDGFVIDETYRCRRLVGAGGTRCPVYRTVFRDLHPRADSHRAAVLEEELACDWQDGACHLWFFDNRLPGYSWYVPKAGGHLNVGIGGMSTKLRERGQDIKEQWAHLAGALAGSGMLPRARRAPRGYTYYLRGAGDAVHDRGAYILGDAAGLATRDLCEGIGPAVESGLRAAEAIAGGAPYSVRTISRYSLPSGLLGQTLAFLVAGRRVALGHD